MALEWSVEIVIFICITLPLCPQHTAVWLVSGTYREYTPIHPCRLSTVDPHPITSQYTIQLTSRCNITLPTCARQYSLAQTQRFSPSLNWYTRFVPFRCSHSFVGMVIRAYRLMFSMSSMTFFGGWDNTLLHIIVIMMNELHCDVIVLFYMRCCIYVVFMYKILDLCV
jgi:hypothetical protein